MQLTDMNDILSFYRIIHVVRTTRDHFLVSCICESKARAKSIELATRKRKDYSHVKVH
jgi:hypothetical protein